MHAMAASYRYFRDIHETDPDTGAWIADRVAVMSAGRIEGAVVESVFVSPKADYTRELLANTPSLNAATAA